MAAEMIKDLKWKVTLEQLNRLRETNPEIPMASTLDIIGGLNTAAEVPSSQLDDDFFQLLSELPALPDNFVAEEDGSPANLQDGSFLLQGTDPDSYPEDLATLDFESLLELE
ncbi:hypothetical protein R3I94_006977 [Phoxinus phoxinus]